MKAGKRKHPIQRPDYRKLRGEKVVGVSLNESDRALLANLAKRIGGKKAAVSAALHVLDQSLNKGVESLSNAELSPRHRCAAPNGLVTEG